MAIQIKGAQDNGNGLVVVQVQSDGTVRIPVDAEDDTVPVVPPPVTTDEKVKATGADTTADYLANKVTVTSGHLAKTTTSPGGNEKVNLALPNVGSGANTTGGGGLVIESIQKDAQGRIVALTTASAGGGGNTLPGGHETVASGALDLTKGHHDLTGSSATLPDGVVDGQIHTFKHMRVVPAPISISGRFNDGGVDDTSFPLGPYRWSMVQWNAATTRWVVKIYDQYTAPSVTAVKDYYISAKAVLIGASPVTICTIPVDGSANIQSCNFILNPGSYPGVPGTADLIMKLEYLGYEEAASTIFTNNDMLQLPGQPQPAGSGSIGGTTGTTQSVAITLEGVVGTIDELAIQLQIRAF